MDVLVIGAGVVGLACAFRLTREGYAVQLVDRDQPGMGASFGNAGHIATEQIMPLASPQTLRNTIRLLLERDGALRIRPRYLWTILPWLARFVWASRPSAFARGVATLSALQATAARDLACLLQDASASRLLHMSGHLVLIERAASLAAAREEIDNLAAHGNDLDPLADWLTPQQVLAIAPDITAPIQGAYHYRASGHVDDPAAVCSALLAAFIDGGGSVARAAIQHLEHRPAEFVATSDDGRRFAANRVLIAAGAWSAPLAKQMGYDVPLDTERGYHITLPGAKPRFEIPIASFERKVIMTPMSCGLRTTGTVEFGGLTLPPDASRWALLSKHMNELVAAMDANKATTWMGYRPSLPDHLPVIGRAPDGRELYFAFGHQHLGLTLAGVTARLLAQTMRGEPTDVDLGALAVDRF